MLKASLIIPLPPGSKADAANGESKPALGLYPCLDDGCDQYVLVKADNKGRPYGTCSQKEITIHGCGCHAQGRPVGIPAQTREAYAERLEAVGSAFPMKATHREYLERAWERYVDDEGGEDEYCD